MTTEPSATPSPDPGAGAPPDLGGILGAGVDPAKAGAAAPEWAGAFDDATKAYVAAKGWKDPGALLESYRAAEKRIGERGLTVPTSLDDADRWGEVYKALGRPETPDGYKFQLDGADPDMLRQASAWFHEAGLAPHQAERVAGAFLEHQKSTVARLEAETAAREVEGSKALREAWGDKYEANLALAFQAGQKLGLSADEMKHLRGTIGVHRFADMLLGIGKELLAEDDANLGARHPTAPASAEEARAELARLMGDPTFVEQLTSPDKTIREAAVARRTALDRRAVGLS